jgi:PAS domain S-box-containing protein
MRYQYIPYIWPLIASAFASLTLGIYALLRRKNTKGAPSFILSMIVVTIWSSANALEMAGADFSTKLFWANIQYFAYCYSPVTLLALCMQFAGFDRWVQNRKILWVAVIPTVIFLLVWTDGPHHLIRSEMHLDYSGPFPVIAKKYGPFFYVHAFYAHALNLIACALLIRATFFKSTIYRKQAAALLLGVSLIVIPNILYVLGFSPIDRFDVTPLFFGPAGLIMAWSIFRFRFFDLVPIARAKVIETMDAGVMVFDLQDRILDINPAFAKIIGLNASLISTKRITEVCGNIPELKKVCLDRTITQTEFSIHTNGLQVYEAFLSPLIDSQGAVIGRLAVIYEITEKKQAQQEFIRQQRKLAESEERERLVRDLHDNLGQVLGFINLQTQGIRQELINAGIKTVSGKLDQLVEVSQAAHTEIREYIRTVRSPAPPKTDFISVLTKKVLIFERETGIKVNLDLPAEFTTEALKPDIWTNLLNIIGEALNNAGKHSKAATVRIAFSLASGQLEALVEDNGKGFEALPNHNAAKAGFGLGIMRERAIEMGAQIEIKSTLGSGSRIVVHIPLKKGETKNESAVGR